MSDEIIEELRRVKGSIAQEHGYDIESFVAHLQSKRRAEGQQVVDLRAMRKMGIGKAKQGPVRHRPVGRISGA